MVNKDSKTQRGRPSRRMVYQRFATTIEALVQYGGLPTPNEARALWNNFWYREAHHSTAIEGNTLVLKEVERLLHEGRATGSKELKDYLEVLGYAEAADWVYHQAITPENWVHDELLVMSEIRYVHTLVLSKDWEVAPPKYSYDDERPGSFRKHNIEPFVGGMTPPTHPLVQAELSLWLDYVNRFGVAVKNGNIGLIDVPEELAFIHKEFEYIHPFLDGNGRTGRLLLNLVLLRLGWPPTIILKNQRRKYLSALDKADKGDSGPLAEMLCRSIIDNAYYLIPDIAGLESYVPLEALVSNDFSLAALRQAAARGRLDIILSHDGRRLSSAAAVKKYKESRRNTKLS